MFLSTPRRHPNARSFRGLVDGSLMRAVDLFFAFPPIILAMAIAGPYAQLGRDHRALDGGEWEEAYLYSRSVTISSGTSEVLRNLVAQQTLGLPRAVPGRD